MLTDKKTVYVADDDPAIRQLVHMSLASLPDLQITVFEDGLELLRAVQVQPPDLVVTDIILPRLEGLAVARLLKFDEATRGLPLLVMSSIIDRDVARQVEDVRADGFLRKPFRPSELRERVKALLEPVSLLAPKSDARG